MLFGIEWEASNFQSMKLRFVCLTTELFFQCCSAAAAKDRKKNMLDTNNIVVIEKKHVQE